MSVKSETLSLTTGLRDYAIFNKVYKSGNTKNLVVYFNPPSSVTTNINAGYSTNIATLPEEYIPICDFQKEIRIKDGSVKAHISINSSTGIITLTFRETTPLKYCNIFINEVYI